MNISLSVSNIRNKVNKVVAVKKSTNLYILSAPKEGLNTIKLSSQTQGVQQTKYSF